MKKGIQSYLAFTSVGYRILVFGLLPIVSIAATLLLAGNMDENFIILMVLATFCEGEMIADFWTFGGVLSKKGGMPEYLKTSPKGMTFLISAIRTNMGRQFCMELLLFFLLKAYFCLIGKTEGMGIWTWLYGFTIVCISYMFAQLGITLARKGESLQFQALITGGIEILMIACIMWVSYSFNPVFLILFIVLAILVCIGSVWLVKQKGVRGYYDQES